MLVMVVEDEPLVRMGVEGLLQELGHRTICATSGKDALKKLEEESGVQLVITDFRMPGISGLDLIARCRSLRPNLKIILMTGYSSNDHVFPEDCPIRLCKPFDISDLNNAIRLASLSEPQPSDPI